MRETTILNYIKKALKEEHLYTTEEIIYLKTQLKYIQNIISENRKLNNKGFGK